MGAVGCSGHQRGGCDQAKGVQCAAARSLASHRARNSHPAVEGKGGERDNELGQTRRTGHPCGEQEDHRGGRIARRKRSVAENERERENTARLKERERARDGGGGGYERERKRMTANDMRLPGWGECEALLVAVLSVLIAAPRRLCRRRRKQKQQRQFWSTTMHTSRKPAHNHAAHTRAHLVTAARNIQDI